MNRTQLIEQIYTKRRDLYKDIRHLFTERSISRRLGETEKLVLRIPINQRNASNRKYKKLWLERRLLRWKRELYTNYIPELTLIRWRAELTDKRYGVEENVDNDQLKKDHTIALLELEFFTKSDAQLTEILAFIEAEDNQ